MMVLRNAFLVLLALAVFAVPHSLAAGGGLKNRLAAILGSRVVEGWYRLAYNLFSVITLIPALAALIALPDQPLYRVPLPWSLMLYGLQGVGVAGFLWAILSIDSLRLMGVSQARAFLAGAPLPLAGEPLQTGGVYRLVRHPLYSFCLLAVWSAPVMTLNMLYFNVGATVYVVIGSLIEERRLEADFGETYHSYRQQVSWLIPWPRSKTRDSFPARAASVTPLNPQS